MTLNKNIFSEKNILVSNSTNSLIFSKNFSPSSKKSFYNFSKKEIKNIIIQKNKENGNLPHNPESSNLLLSEYLKKKFALSEVFSKDVSKAHLNGDIHIHDLGTIDRPYCSGQSIEYIKKFGLNFPHLNNTANPANHADVLILQIVKFSSALQGHFSGAIGWDAFNLFLAPLLVGLEKSKLKQLSQLLLFEFSQQSILRGGQVIFSDINLYWEIPDHFVGVPAIGPNGKYTGKNYEHYLKESQDFLEVLLEVYLEGDGTGKPFFFPKPQIHITEKLFKTEGHEKFLIKASELASKQGSCYFVFDRGNEAKISECCRLVFQLDSDDLQNCKFPWKMRFSATQNITLNLPRIGYLSNKNDKKLFQLIKKKILLSIKAHLQKKEFLKSLLQLKEEGPLSLLSMDVDGEPYYKLEKSVFLIGILGLNELVQYHIGQEIHESKEAQLFGLKIVSFIKSYTLKMSKKFSLKVILEQTPAESTSYRFATLDSIKFPQESKLVIKGNLETKEIFYTNSSHININSNTTPVEKVKIEGNFHPLITAGSLTHIWLGENSPSPESISNFIKKTFYHTTNAQIAFSPEFSFCNDCQKNYKGLLNKCLSCNSSNLEWITRVTGYFSKVSSWNKGKIGELHSRSKSLFF